MQDLNPQQEEKIVKIPCTLELTEQNKAIIKAEFYSDLPNYQAKYVEPMARALKNAAVLMEASQMLLDKLDAPSSLVDANGSFIALNGDATEEKAILRNLLRYLKGNK